MIVILHQKGEQGNYTSLIFGASVLIISLLIESFPLAFLRFSSLILFEIPSIKNGEVKDSVVLNVSGVFSVQSCLF